MALADGTGRRLVRTIVRSIPHSDDDLPLRTPSLNVGQGIRRLLKRENFVNGRTDYAGFDQGSDLAQLLPLRSHEQERIAYAKRSEEHTSELQSRFDLVCRLL